MDTAHRTRQDPPPGPLSAGTVSAGTRVGTIAFLNCHPIRWGLARQPQAFDQVTGSPGDLARQLLTGRLDVGPVSLLDYLEHADQLVLVPDLAIGSDGPVQSCVLASSLPLAELGGRRVLLSRLSRTTVLLARIYLEEVVGVRPDYATAGQGAASVIIGDEALRLTATAPAGRTIYDIGTIWQQWTGLPMVFAVWAARREFATKCPDALRQVRRALAAALDDAGRDPSAVVAAAVPASGGLGTSALAAYFQTLDYSFGERQKTAVQVFAKFAATRHPIAMEYCLD